MLHCVFNSPFTHGDLAQALAYRREGEALLLLQDAVVALVAPEWLEKLPTTALYYLTADVYARGLTPSCGIGLSDLQWVELVAAQDSSLSWI